MGIKTILTDDLTGSELPDNTEATTVTVEGTKYDVYLSDDSKENFMAFLAGDLPLSPATRPATARSTRGSRSTSPNTDNAAIREWAQMTGYNYKGADGKDRTLGDRGAIPDVVTQAWKAAGSPAVGKS